MKASDRCKAHLREYEGNELAPYQDGGDVWTIGVGHTRIAEELHVVGLTLTQPQVDKLFAWDLLGYEEAVTRAVKVTLKQHQFDALVAFAFNVGVRAFEKSSLLRKLNAGDYAGASAEFGKWVYDNGKAIKGLTRRREAERRMFEGVA